MHVTCYLDNTTVEVNMSNILIILCCLLIMSCCAVRRKDSLCMCVLHQQKKGGTGGGGWGHVPRSKLCTWRVLGLAVKRPWLVLGGLILALAACMGLENATLTLKGVHF